MRSTSYARTCGPAFFVFCLYGCTDIEAIRAFYASGGCEQGFGWSMISVFRISYIEVGYIHSTSDGVTTIVAG
jgi:hypothetical protein